MLGFFKFLVGSFDTDSRCNQWLLLSDQHLPVTVVQVAAVQAATFVYSLSKCSSSSNPQRDEAVRASALQLVDLDAISLSRYIKGFRGRSNIK